jgi:hypothetical protein
MIENLLDPTVLFFLVGMFAGVLRTDLRLPEAVYEILSIYLLLAIGLKGGVQLATTSLGDIIPPAVGTIMLGIIIPVIAYPILRRVGKLSRPDAAAIAAHYGSVSAVTYAIVLTFLEKLGVHYEAYSTVLLVLLEIPAIAVGILIARLRAAQRPTSFGKLFHEVFFGKSVYLLFAGLLVGYGLGPERIVPMKLIFFDMFKGALAFFLLEMGLVVSHRLSDLKRVGTFLILFGVGMPILAGSLGALTGWVTGLSVGGTTILATLAASASYIAAPAAMRIAVPEANPTLYVTASLGITFPFNLVLGIPLYHWMATLLH